MPLNASEIRVAGTGRVLTAPAHTAPPEDFDADWAVPPWVDLGYTSADGVKFTKKDKLDPIDTWQTVAAIRFVYSDRDFSVKFTLLQVNAQTLHFFFGDTAPSDAEVLTYEIAAAPRVNERALGIEFNDGPDITHRFVIPRGVVTETDETSFTRTSAVKLGVTFSALTPLTARAEPLAVWTMNTTGTAPPAAPGQEAEPATSAR